MVTNIIAFYDTEINKENNKEEEIKKLFGIKSLK